MHGLWNTVYINIYDINCCISLLMLLYITGFDEICQDDQINLIKQGSFEILVVRMCNLVDIEKEEMFDPDMKMKCPK